MFGNFFNFIRAITEKLGLFNRSFQGKSSGTVTADEYQNFLLEVLQVTLESKGDRQAVYPLLQANLDKLDDNFTSWLRSWTTNTLSNAEADKAEEIASSILIFSNLVQEYPYGSKAVNQDIAIAGYLTALSVYTRDAFPEKWAMTQNILGIAYSDRIKGDRGENLELAIAAFTHALQVRTRDAFPEDWAITQNNLGIAYGNRIKGDRGENLELAIAAFTHALQVYQSDAFPEKWAITQNNLGNAYSDRIKGDRGENLELAIAAFTHALQVITRDAFPEKWAMTQNNLGNAYFDRIKGDRGENLELAIAAFTHALQVYKRDAFPVDWAATQNNLGLAYSNRIKGDRGENLELAIAAYTQALQVRTRDAFPEQWADIQNNLGNAYGNRIKGDRGENLELAIAAFTHALQVYKRDAFPEQWAMTQNNLGNAYSDRIKGDTGENLELAIAAYTHALQVYQSHAFPEQWAITQNNLGVTYSNRIKGDRGENLELAIAACTHALQVYQSDAFPEQWAGIQNNLGVAYRYLEQFDKAIECFKLALEIRTPTTLPRDCLQSGRNLGDTAFLVEKWSEAIFGYDAAIQAVEQSREWASSQKTRQSLLEDAIDVYNQIVQACINTNQIEKAIEYVERSKARTLVELLANHNLYPKGDIPQELLEQLERLKREIPPKQQLLEFGTLIDTKTQSTEKSLSLSANDVKRLRQELNELHSELERVLNQIKRFDPSYQLTQKVQPISFPDIRSTIDNHTAIIAWYIRSNRFFTFIITREHEPLCWQSDSKDLEALEEWRNEYLNDYKALKDKKTQTWQTDFTKLQKLSEILHLDNLFSNLPSDRNQLILIPHRYLHLFPLHALPLQGFQCLLDKFCDGVRYAPSHQLLQLSQKLASQQTSSVKSFFAIQNPTNDLEFTDIEVEAIQHRFDDKQILAQEKATKNNLLDQSPAFRNAEYLHFSCHGSFHAPNPLLSHLLLAESVVASNGSTERTAENTRYLSWRDSLDVDLEKCLTLSDIFALNLKQCHLVTLSACETGLTDWRNLTDEYIGLASGFLVAGSPRIVSSLWLVDDVSTCFLMIRFYQNLQPNSTIAKALNEAQRWLRDVTKEGLQQWIEELSFSPGKKLWLQSKLWLRDVTKEDLQNLIEELSFPPGKKLWLQSKLNQASTQPFHSPEHWAAFCTVGN